MPKFNLNWLYMIIAMMLLGLYLTNESGSASKNIPYDEFQEYVRNGYISKVTGYDDNLAWGVSLTDDKIITYCVVYPGKVCYDDFFSFFILNTFCYLLN